MTTKQLPTVAPNRKERNGGAEVLSDGLTREERAKLAEIYSESMKPTAEASKAFVAWRDKKRAA